MNTSIRPLATTDSQQLQDHFRRHWAESGQNGVHFMPFAPGKGGEFTDVDLSPSQRSVVECGWQRWFVSVDDGRIIGHVSLKGSSQKVALHRCELGIGVERAYRGRGIGRRLMGVAIEFARSTSCLAWIDLKVFAQNSIAIGLYRSVGFVEVAIIRDQFRIDQQQIDDLSMTLKVARQSLNHDA